MSNPQKTPEGPHVQVHDLEAELRAKVIARDSRYEIGAYLFLYEALAWTQKHLGRDDATLEAPARHVTGQELLTGIHDYAFELFGPLAPVVFRRWGIRSTLDFGHMVFNLVESELLGKTDSDRREDFADGFDFDTAFEG